MLIEVTRDMVVVRQQMLRVLCLILLDMLLMAEAILLSMVLVVVHIVVSGRVQSLVTFIVK